MSFFFFTRRRVKVKCHTMNEFRRASNEGYSQYAHARIER